MTRGSCDMCGLMGASDVSEHTGIHEASICTRCEITMAEDMKACWDAIDLTTMSDDWSER